MGNREGTARSAPSLFVSFSTHVLQGFLRPGVAGGAFPAKGHREGLGRNAQGPDGGALGEYVQKQPLCN